MPLARRRQGLKMSIQGKCPTITQLVFNKILNKNIQQTGLDSFAG